ncbi:helix-turn-helix domain-containing protein [Thiomicrospira microaerophila]|uniref:helix-turn-helix domain-containing protein n=1 Tax=Thiomicrospira microaerophila TaxID=406020 RepID=UPI000A0426A1|nr:helix-turn-helix transcriptional regulator [Thiomicrospira microaerophila]
MLSRSPTASFLPSLVVGLLLDDALPIFRALRSRMRMSPSGGVARMGLPQSNVSRIESGKTLPSFQTIKAYAKALDILPEQLDLG